ncbi:M28 family peptidase [Spongiimicrobium sp. 2-473A-2-J]|uniref:M28 family peptidase n=1 Tax=Eudoraea algarum TaxID=3417568 RepID=UPI003D35B19D
MKHLAYLTIALALACNSSQKTVIPTDENAGTAQPELTYAKTITEQELKDHLYTYASDEFEGRETGTPGQKKAVAYIKSEYEKMGVPAAKADGDYFQNVPLQTGQAPEGNVSINGTEYPLGESIVTFTPANGTYSELVYVGYGIEQDDYSDYKDLDVTGKIVLFKAGEPMDGNGSYTLSGTDQKSAWSSRSEAISKRFELALNKGAKGVIYWDDTNFGRIQRRFNNLKNINKSKLGLQDNVEPDFISFIVNGDMARRLMSDIATEHAARVLPVSLSFAVENTGNGVQTENVAAIIRGSEKPNEYLIISSHLDHIGVTDEGEINNGADDDGSGTVALLEIAEAFKQAADAGMGPKRSIIFLHVTGEEKGLLGSQYYTDVAPIFPLSQTVANLNIDMIGRIDPKRDGDRNYIYLIGSDKLSSDLHQLSEAINAKYTQLELDYTYNDENDPNRFYFRSDHYNFAKNNIPIIFYFNGTHADYHRPTDTADKINYDLLRNRTQLIFYTAWEVANREQRVVVDKVAK